MPSNRQHKGRQAAVDATQTSNRSSHDAHADDNDDGCSCTAQREIANLAQEAVGEELVRVLERNRARVRRSGNICTHHGRTLEVSGVRRYVPR